MSEARDEAARQQIRRQAEIYKTKVKGNKIILNKGKSNERVLLQEPDSMFCNSNTMWISVIDMVRMEAGDKRFSFCISVKDAAYYDTEPMTEEDYEKLDNMWS